MGLNEWANERIRNLDWSDISLTKLSAAAFILMVAKLWAPLLSLEWYWYGIFFVLAGIKPLYKVYFK